jgi:uncharacterized protein
LTAQGHPRAIFSRAIERGNVMLAELTARELATTGLVDLSAERLNTLRTALEGHSDGLTSEDPTIGVCWDADRLHLPRVGLVVAARLLSTRAAKTKHANAQAAKRRGQRVDWELVAASVTG